MQGVRKTQEDIEKEIYDLVEDEYLVVGEYIAYNTKLKLLHVQCNNIYEVIPNHFINRNHRCPKCSHLRRKRNGQLILEKVQHVFKSRNFQLLNLTEYRNNNTKLLYICNNHPEEGIQEATYGYVERANTCKKCNSGEYHHSWKGGISSLRANLRYKIKPSWKIKSLQSTNYKCALTNENERNLDIHHLYSFNLIIKELQETLQIDLYKNIRDYQTDELFLIENEFFKIHDKYGLGVPLKSNIHKLFHDVYGRGDNTPEQFEEFKKRFFNYEFDSLLNEVI